MLLIRQLNTFRLWFFSSNVHSYSVCPGAVCSIDAFIARVVPRIVNVDVSSPYSIELTPKVNVWAARLCWYEWVVCVCVCVGI